MNRLKYFLFFIISIFSLSSCIEDGVSSDPGLQPAFSVDTLKLGEIFTDELTPTSRFTVYNHGDKILNINSISIREDLSRIYRLNVDGFSGETFSNVEIRPNDSIFVYVEALVPENSGSLPVELNSIIDFTTLGVTKSVVINATTQNVERLRGNILSADATFTAEMPYIIYDSLVVEQGATLTLAPGTKLLFHDSAYLRVKGTLKSSGTAEKPVELRGDRNGYVATNIPYEIMSGQWAGVIFNSSSKGNVLEYTTVKNSELGVIANNTDITAVNSVFRNSKDYAFSSISSDVRFTGVEFAEAANGLLYLEGGTATLDFCTLSNNYLFSAISGPALQLNHIDADTDNESGLPYLTAEIRNTIIYGIGNDISHGDLTGREIYLRNCMLRSAGSNDDNFIDCIWDTDPLFMTVRNDYYFDYRLMEESPAIGAGNPSFISTEASVDRYGNKRSASNPDLGAYVFIPQEQETINL